jgi:hypothetical protein
MVVISNSCRSFTRTTGCVKICFECGLQLDDKYNRCLDEVQSTTSKFNSLMQQGGARIRAPFAHRVVSAMYRGLRRRIMAAANGRRTCWGESSAATAGDMERSLESALIQKHWAARGRRVAASSRAAGGRSAACRRGPSPCSRPGCSSTF